MALALTSDTRPWFTSVLARLGVAVLVGLGIYVGYKYWIDRGEEQLAIMTVGAELIAFAGLVVVRHNWKPKTWGWAIVGLFLTALAAGWCGMTMFEKISDDARARAIEAAQQTLPYRVAARDFEEASAALRLKLAEDQPTDVGPQYLANWEVAQAAAVARLTAARDNAEARLQAATPPVALDVMAIIRGVSVELVKLLGFAAFGLWGQSETRASSAPAKPKKPFWAKVKGLLGLGAIATGMVATAHAREPAFAPVASDANAAPARENVLVLNLDAKAKAFSMRDRWTRYGRKPTKADIAEIADACGVSISTIYRWFAKRDKELAAKRIAAAA